MNMDRDKEPTPKPNPIIEKQIQEILRNSERTYRRKIFWNRLSNGVSGFFSRVGQGGGRSASPFGRLMLWGIVLVVLGMIASGIGPVRPIASLLVLGGIVLFLSPIFLSIRRTGGGSGYSGDEKYWRGRPVVTGDDPWGSTKQQFQGVMRWLRGGDKNPPSPPRGSSRR